LSFLTKRTISICPTFVSTKNKQKNEKGMVYNRQLRGLGRNLTEAVLAKGDNVAATARSTAKTRR